MVAAHLTVSRPFPRGRTAKGGEVVILTWRDLEFVVFGANLRAPPPLTFQTFRHFFSALMSFYVYHPFILFTKTPRHEFPDEWRG